MELAGRIIAVTGASNGIGRAAAIDLAQRGAKVLLLVRDPSRGEAVRVTIAGLTGDTARARIIKCDLASFRSVRHAAAEVRAWTPWLDALVNNAGIVAPQRELTADGHELTFQVNHLSHFLLTSELLPVLTQAAGRIVTVSSDAHFAAWNGIRLDDLDFSRGWKPFRAYAHSKLANIMFTYELARRTAGTRVTANVMHPGAVESGWGSRGWGATGFLWRTFVPKITVEQGADTLSYLAGASEVEGVSGRYFFRRAPKDSSPSSFDRDVQSRLWEVSEEWTGGGIEGA
jgi:NAD(P)-dependent dehydrogenase (short-subunit alcohol dehydrogenase family)